MKSFVAFVTLCLATASAQFGQFGTSSYWPNPYGPYYGDRNCPTSLLSSLSTIVQTLYSYGQDPYQFTANPYGGVASNLFSQGFAGLSAGAQGFQTSPLAGNYNPTCPWPLINALIAQIQNYVNQLQSAATRTGPGVNPYPNPFFADDTIAFLGNRGRLGSFRGVKK